jgi:hypothetical protein
MIYVLFGLIFLLLFVVVIYEKRVSGLEWILEQEREKLTNLRKESK